LEKKKPAPIARAGGSIYLSRAGSIYLSGIVKGGHHVSVDLASDNDQFIKTLDAAFDLNK
jgi:hypothetical protein